MSAAAQGVIVPTAEVADLPDYGEVAKAVKGTKKQSPNNIPGTLARLVKQVGADTTLKNAERDGAQFAWVPHGDTCAFCIALASRGWQYKSKKAMRNGHAEHIHAHCDCEYAVRFDGKSTVAGYDPDKYLEEYYDETNTETAQNDLLSQILENSKVSGYPQDLYDKCKEEYDANNQILADMFGIDVSDIASSEDNVKSAVEEMVYTEMLTTAIAEKENITVSDDEYTDYVNSVYEESGYTSAEEYEEDYTKDETVNTILYNKVMDFLMQNATVTEVSEDEYYEEDTEMDEEAYDTEEITENETDAEDLEMTE